MSQAAHPGQIFRGHISRYKKKAWHVFSWTIISGTPFYGTNFFRTSFLMTIFSPGQLFTGQLFSGTTFFPFNIWGQISSGTIFPEKKCPLKTCPWRKVSQKLVPEKDTSDELLVTLSIGGERENMNEWLILIFLLDTVPVVMGPKKQVKDSRFAHLKPNIWWWTLAVESTTLKLLFHVCFLYAVWKFKGRVFQLKACFIFLPGLSASGPTQLFHSCGRFWRT